MSAEPIRVLRLNSSTAPVTDVERRYLSQLGAQIIEVENPEECSDLASIDGVMIISAYLRTDVVKQLKRCKIISRLGTGCDKIDIEEATRQGILVTNVPDALTEEVADHTVALLLSVHRRLKLFEKAMRQGYRPMQHEDVKRMRRLSTQTVGIIGFGRIGRAFAERMKGFGVRILVSDPVASQEQIQSRGYERADNQTILKESDYVCLLCPLTPDTRGMLAMPQFKQMKSTAVLINTGRGELVNERDLAEALNTKVIAYAGVDVYGDFNVFAEGGFPTDHPLFSVENIEMTPHVAAASIEASEEVLNTASQAVVDVLSGRKPTFIVNPAVVGSTRASLA